MSDAILREMGLAVGDTISVTAPTCGSRSASSTRRSTRSLRSGARIQTCSSRRPAATSARRGRWPRPRPSPPLGGTVYNEYRVVDQPLTLTDAAALRSGYAEATAQWTSSFPRAEVGIERNELERVVGRAGRGAHDGRAQSGAGDADGSGRRHDRARRRRRAAGTGPPARAAAAGRARAAAATDRVACRPSPRRRDRRGSVVGWFDRVVGDHCVRAVAEPGTGRLAALGGVGRGRRRARARARRRGGRRSSPTGSPTFASGASTIGGWDSQGWSPSPCWPASPSGPSTATAACGLRGRVTRREPAGDGLPVVRVAGDDGDRRSRRGAPRAPPATDWGLPAAVVATRVAPRRARVRPARGGGRVGRAGRRMLHRRQRARRRRRAPARRQGAGVRRAPTCRSTCSTRLECPAAWEARATMISKTRVRYGDTRADLVGIDRSRFAGRGDAAGRRSDASRSIELVAAIATGRRWTVGARDRRRRRLRRGRCCRRSRCPARWTRCRWSSPRQRTSSRARRPQVPMFVVDRAAAGRGVAVRA